MSTSARIVYLIVYHRKISGLRMSFQVTSLKSVYQNFSLIFGFLRAFLPHENVQIQMFTSVNSSDQSVY